jgi:hypothetical protein
MAAAAKKKPADADVWQNAYGADLGKSKPVKAMPFLERVHVTLGGFFGGETIWRQHNMTSDESDAWAAIPFPFQPTYGEREFRASGREGRFTILTEGNIDPKRKLSAYAEADFYGAGTTSNYNQSNSWAARLRQGYLAYDDNNLGFHFLAGQAWSLLTQNTVGITPRKENFMLVLDHNYVVGFEYTRNWQGADCPGVRPDVDGRRLGRGAGSTRRWRGGQRHRRKRGDRQLRQSGWFIPGQQRLRRPVHHRCDTGCP